MTRQERRQNPDYRIAELEAEVERLRAERDAALSEEDRYQRKLLVVEAEVERLREALEQIAAWPDDTDAVPDSEDYRYWAGGNDQASIARRALEEK